MREQITCEFVVFAYASDPAKEDLLPVALASRELGCRANCVVTLHVVSFLQAAVRPAHLGYLHELFDDWRATKGDKVDLLFREFSSLGSGPVRVLAGGFCAPKDLPLLAERFLTRELREP